MRLQKLIPTLVSLACMALATDCAIGEKLRPSTTSAPAKIVDTELIVPVQNEHVHSSSIVELSDGTLLAAWFQGSGEKDADDVRIMGARKRTDMAEWGEPFMLADTPGHPDCNPVLWIDDQDRLWLFWSAILSNEWGSSLVKYRISTSYLAIDGPPQWDWQDNLHLKPADFPRHMRSGWRQLVATVLFVPRAIRAELSAISLPSFLVEEWKVLATLALLSMAPWAIHAWRRSRTGRAGWKRFALRATALYASLLLVGMAATMGYFSLQARTKLNQRLGWLTANKPVQLSTGEIVLPLYSDRFLASIMAISTDQGISWQASEPLIGYGNIQPSLVETSSGELMAWMRESGLRKRVRHSVSSNQGRTWSPVVETDLPNPGTKVAVLALASGKWVIAYNPLVDGRHSLSLAISDDDGDTWRPLHQLEDVSPDEGSFSYPCLLETSDGRILVTYSCKRRLDGKRLESIKQVTLQQPKQLPQVRLAENELPTLR